MKVSKSILNKIAQELDCGNTCYYNTKTDEIISIPYFSDMWDEDDFKEAFEIELKQVKKQKKDLIKLEGLESFESFKIMEQFVGQLPDEALKGELEFVLANKKPFQKFKYLVEESNFRTNWFEFKQNALEKIVE
ncbi:UPF0158 family protein [Algibacter pacificus]|uniref:UPF0158 family protein n=1 Tax=Algibacter pacificus TaxID=2599389 RepID=UPI0011C9BA11|nr:UPF0158 family protein [Algibacter pacificus]